MCNHADLKLRLAALAGRCPGYGSDTAHDPRGRGTGRGLQACLPAVPQKRLQVRSETQEAGTAASPDAAARKRVRIDRLHSNQLTNGRRSEYFIGDYS